jgi:ABC-type sugar transport system permease subunit
MGYAAALAVVIFVITLVASVVQLFLNRQKAVQY